LLAKKKKEIPQYSTTTINGKEYYRTRIVDTDGKRVTLYGKTPEELYDKVQEAQQKIQQYVYHRNNPTVKHYCEQWLEIQSSRVREATMVGYRNKVNKYIIKPLGHLHMSDVKQSDIQIALIPVLKLSESMYHTTYMLYQMIFNSAVDNNIINDSPCKKISPRGGVPAKPKEALTDEQVIKLLNAIKGSQTYVFVMIGLYAGLRREEILALKWDCVFLDVNSPYISVQRSWTSPGNKNGVISDLLKTDSSRRNVPIPSMLLECLIETKQSSKSDFVIANQNGNQLSYTQYQRMWKYIETRTAGEASYVRYDKNGQKTTHTFQRVLGEKANNNPNVTYSLDFHVTPHQLRHTYITNLINAAVDPKTVQYLAGHKNSKITMDVYAKVKYNQPDKLISVVNSAFSDK
jgi:integrase